MATISTPYRRTLPLAGEAIVTRYPQMGMVVTPSNDIFEGPVNIRAGGGGVVVCVPEAYRAAIVAGGTITDYDVPVTVPAGGDVPFEVCMVLATSTATLMIASW